MIINLIVCINLGEISQSITAVMYICMHRFLTLQPGIWSSSHSTSEQMSLCEGCSGSHGSAHPLQWVPWDRAGPGHNMPLESDCRQNSACQWLEWCCAWKLFYAIFAGIGKKNSRSDMQCASVLCPFKMKIKFTQDYINLTTNEMLWICIWVVKYSPIYYDTFEACLLQPAIFKSCTIR